MLGYGYRRWVPRCAYDEGFGAKCLQRRCAAMWVTTMMGRDVLKMTMCRDVGDDDDAPGCAHDDDVPRCAHDDDDDAMCSRRGRAAMGVTTMKRGHGATKTLYRHMAQEMETLQ